MQEKSSTYRKISFYLLVLSLFSLPLAITAYFENASDLVKGASLKFFGGVFIIYACYIIIKKIYENTHKADLLKIDKTFDPFIAFLFIAAVISALFSLNASVSYFGQYYRQIGLITYIYVCLIYLLSSALFKNKENVNRTFLIAETAAIIAAMEAFLQVIGIDILRIQPINVLRPVSTFGNSVFFAEFLVLIFPFSVFNLSQKKSKILKYLFPLILFIGIIISQTRSAYVALLAEFIIILIFYPALFKQVETEYKKKIRFSLLVFASIAVLFIVFGIISSNSLYFQRFETIFSSWDNPRFLLWRDSFELFKSYPLTGTGIAMFPAAFESFYSLELRIADTLRTFDNPHNNFIHILCTMGIFGFIAFVMIIVQAVKVSWKSIISSEKAKKEKVLYLSFLVMFCGYVVYGMTNFDDINSMFYIFVFLAILKSVYNQDKDHNYTGFILYKFKKFIAPIAFIIIIFCIYNFYMTFNELKADRYFRTALELNREGKFTETVNNLNEALKYNPRGWHYRITLASVVYTHVSESASLSKESKENIFNQVLDELNRARKYPFLNSRSDAILSLVYYELGRKSEADSIKKTLLQRDPVSIDYRVQLSRYNYRTDNIYELAENREIISKYAPNFLGDFAVSAMYYMKINDKRVVELNCRKILELEPDNKFALDLLREMGY